MCWLQQSAQLWHYPTFLLPPLFLIALIECFAGYHAWRFLLGLNGAVLGFVAGALAGMMLGAPMLMLFAALAGAVAGAGLFAGIVPVGSFLFAFGSASSLTIVLGRVIGLASPWCVALGAGAGLAAAIGAFSGRRPVMIVVAAVAGAQQIAGAWCAYFLPGEAMPMPNVVGPSEWGIFLGLAGAGLVMQFVTSRRVGMAEKV